MDPVTDNPAPAPGILERFLEQLGAWLDAFPSVPHWVQWIAVVMGIGVPIVTIVWVRWAANWWAARSSNAAEKRARNLLKRVVEVHAFSRNRPAMLVLGLRVIVALIWASMFLVLGIMILMHVFSPNESGLPPSDSLISGRRTAGNAVTGWAMCCILYAAFMDIRFQLLADIDGYTARSRTRIKKLLAKAGVPDEFAVEFLRSFDDQVDVARKQDIR